MTAEVTPAARSVGTRAMAEPPNPLRHPGAQGAVGSCHLDGDVKLGARDLEVVAHGGMRGVEQGANCGQPSGAQQGHRLAYPFDLGHDVSGSSPNRDVRQPIQGLVTVVESRLPQRGRAQLPGRLLVAVAPLRVLPVDQGVLGAGVHDEQRQAVGGQVEGHLGYRPVATVEQQRMADPAAQGRGLVHAAGRAWAMVFSALTMSEPGRS